MFFLRLRINRHPLYLYSAILASISPPSRTIGKLQAKASTAGQLNLLRYKILS